MALSEMIKKFWEQHYDFRIEGNEEWRKGCIDSVKNLAKCAETEDASAEDLLFVGDLVSEILKDPQYALRFAHRSTAKRAAELSAYCREQFPKAFEQYRSALSLKDAFEKMLLFHFLRHSDDPELERMAELPQEALLELNDGLFAFYELVVREDHPAFVKHTEAPIYYDGYYAPLGNVLIFICRWLISFSSDHEAILTCVEELVRGRLMNRGKDPSDFRELSYEDDSWLCCAAGEEYWSKPDLPSKEKGLVYLWMGIRGTLIPETREENIAYLIDTFCKAKEIDLQDRKIWSELAQDMEYLNELSNTKLFGEQMIAECKKRASLI